MQDQTLVCQTLQPCGDTCANGEAAQAYLDEFQGAADAAGFGEVLVVVDASVENDLVNITFGLQREGASSSLFLLTAADDPAVITEKIEETIGGWSADWLDPELQLIDADQLMAAFADCDAELAASSCATEAVPYDPCTSNSSEFIAGSTWFQDCGGDCAQTQNFVWVDMRTGVTERCEAAPSGLCGDDG